MSGQGAPWEDFKPSSNQSAPTSATEQGPWNDFAPKTSVSASPPAPPSPGVLGTVADIGKGAWSGILQGASALSGLQGDVGKLGERGFMAAYDALNPGHGDTVKATNDLFDAFQGAIPPGISGLSGSQSNINALAPIGSRYDPKTVAGQYARTIGAFAPAAIGGEGAILPRLAGRVLAPAVASETAGQLTAGSPYEGTARTAGAILGGLPSLTGAGIGAGSRLATGVAARSAEPLDPVSASLVQQYEGMGGNLRPGQYSPANIVRQGDSVVADTPFPKLAGFSDNSPTRISPAAQANQFNTLVSNTFGESASRITGDVLDRARSRIGQVYNTVLPRNSVVEDSSLAGAMDSVANKLSEAAPAMDPRDVTKISAVMNRLKGQLAADGGFTGKQYQLYRGRDGVLDELASSGTPTIKWAANTLRASLDDAFARQAQGDDATLLQEANRQYRALSTLAPVAAKAANGNISPKLLLGAVNSEYGHPDNAGALGVLARVGKAFISEPANSGTSERTFWRTLQGSPLKAGRMALDNLLAAPYSAVVTRGINNTINSPNMRTQLLANAPSATNIPGALGAALRYARNAAPSKASKLTGKP